MQLRSILSITVLGIALAAGCAKKPDDAALVTNIKAQMFSDAQLKGANLQVTSKNGQVTLSGTVPSDAARLDADKIATQMPGVTKVSDQMTVAGAESAQAQTAPPETAQASTQAESRPSPEATPATPPPASKKLERERRRRERARAPESAVAETDQTSAAPPEPQAPATPAAQSQDQASQAAAPAVASNPPPAAAPTPAPAPPPQPTRVQIPAGTTMSIRMIDAIDSSVNQPGEIFHAALDEPVAVGDQVVVPKDADVYVRLASVSSAGRMKGQSELELQLVKLEFQGQSYPLVSSTYTLKGGSRGKDTTKKVGAGAILGTLLGAIAGGGKGAAIGAAAGAGAGGAYQAATHGKQVKIPSETKLDFQLEQPVTVTVMPHQITNGQ
jgi:BON domain